MSWIEALERAKDPLHEIWGRRMEDIADTSRYPAQYTMDAITMLLSPDQIDEIWGTEPEPRTAAARGAPGGAWQLRDSNGRWVQMAEVEALLAGVAGAYGWSPEMAEEFRARFEDHVAVVGDVRDPEWLSALSDTFQGEQLNAATQLATALREPDGALADSLRFTAEDATDIASTMDTQGGFTFDPGAGGFVETGYQVAIPGNELRVAKADFDRQVLADFIQSASGGHIGGWVHEDEYVFDISENFDDEAEAGMAMIDRGEQALWDFAGSRSVYNPERFDELGPGIYSVFEPETQTVVERDRQAGTYQIIDGEVVWVVTVGSEP